MNSAPRRALPALALLICLAAPAPMLLYAAAADDTAAPALTAAVETSGVAGQLSSLARITQAHTDDLQGMVERRVLRALVAPSKTFFFFDGATARGLSHDMLKAFEGYLNKKFADPTIEISIVFLPVARELLLPALLAGYGDLAVGDLTITTERMQQVQFSVPIYRNVRELVVAGPSSPPIASLDDLSGKKLHTRRSSSYYDSLSALSEKFRAAGRAPVAIGLVDDHMEDEELLEMVNASLIEAIPMDSHTAGFWAQIFDHVDVRNDLVLRQRDDIGWAMRRDNPQLKKVVDEFLVNNRQGSLLGNILIRRYLKETRYVENALQSSEMRKFQQSAPLFKEFAERYDFDWLLVVSQGYQESRLDQSLRSKAGAVGIMQLLPSTAAGEHIAIADISTLKNNIHAGIKYLRFIRDEYFEAQPMSDLDKTLFAFAAYNAGPTRIADLRAAAQSQGLDPNVWFDNVELIAARRIGRETVDYVSNIHKYWTAYRLSRKQLAQSVESGAGRSVPSN